MIKYFSDIFTAVSTIAGGMFITLTHLVKAKKGIATLQYPEERWPRPERNIGFNSDYNKVTMIDKKGNIKHFPKNKKSFIANKIAQILLNKLLDDRSFN